MKLKRRIAVFLTAVSSLLCTGQISVEIQAGAGYIEHFSTGLSLSFRDKHTLSALYGSNFFIRNRDFCNLLLQYDFRPGRMKFGRFNPGFGIKAGYSVFTNKYYRWKLSEIVPFARLSHSMNEKTDFFVDLGMAVSIEHSVERLNYGEIGMYREYLPEFKAGLIFRL